MRLGFKYSHFTMIKVLIVPVRSIGKRSFLEISCDHHKNIRFSPCQKRFHLVIVQILQKGRECIQNKFLNKQAEEALKTVILGGFLGSGKKNTVLLQLARYLAQQSTGDSPTRVAIIENEIGQIGIDDETLLALTPMLNSNLEKDRRI